MTILCAQGPQSGPQVNAPDQSTKGDLRRLFAGALEICAPPLTPLQGELAPQLFGLQDQNACKETEPSRNPQSENVQVFPCVLPIACTCQMLEMPNA